MREFEGKTILSRDGRLKGIASGATHLCSMEGCNGVRVSTKWPDGKTTYPCSKGLLHRPNGVIQIR